MGMDQNRNRLLDLGPQQCLKRDGARAPNYFRTTEDNVVKKASQTPDGEWVEQNFGRITPSAHGDSLDLQLEIAHNDYEIVSIDEYPLEVD